MKKLIIFFSALALISSCAKMDEIGPVQNGQSNDSVALNGSLPEVLYASVVDDQDPQTRTYVDGKSVKWHSAESISYYAEVYGNVKYTMAEGQYDGTVNAEFVKDGDAEYEFVYGGAYGMPAYPLAVYPYDETQEATFSSGEYDVQVKFAKDQTYAPDSFGKGANIMVATGSSNDDENLYFHHACGYLVIKLYGTDTKVSNITLTALGEGVKISGVASLVVDQNQPVQFNQFKNDAAYNTVTLDCSNGGQGVALGADAGQATEFWFALPPVTVTGGFEITVTDTEGYTYTKKTTKDVVIERNKIQPMAALQFVANTPASNRILYTKVADAPIGTITFYNEMTNPFDATIMGHRYDSSVGKYVIEFKTPVKTIQAKAFYGTDIQTIELPDGLETIEDQAFAYTQIRAITIPGSVNTVKSEAFSLCSWLESIEFLPSPTQTPLAIECSQRDFADYGPFENASFKSIDLNRELNYVNPDGEPFTASQVDDALFYNKYPDSSLIITIGGQVRTIPDYMFSGLEFSSLTIPATLSKIGNNVFEECTNLFSVTFEESTEPLHIGYQKGTDDVGPFYYCPLSYIDLNRNLIYDYDDLNEWGEGIFASMYYDSNAFTTELRIGANVKTIHPWMFSGVRVQDLTIPSTVESVGNEAFYDCRALRTVSLDAYSVGDGVFYKCGNLESVTIGGGVFAIGYNSFAYCTNLSTVNISEGTSGYGLRLRSQRINGQDWGTFYDSPLASISVARDINYLDYAGSEFNPDDWDEGVFANKHYSKEDLTATVTIGNKVTNISNYMFSGVRMAEVRIPSKVVTIGDGAFAYCYLLEKVYSYPYTAPSMGEAAFEDCDKLTSIKVYKGCSGSYTTRTGWVDYADLVSELNY